MRRPRIGLLVLFVPFYEKIAALRSEKEMFAGSVEHKLSEVADVIFQGLIETEEAARNAAAFLTEKRVDAVVVVPSLATFGLLGWAAVRELELPVALWSVQPASRVPDPCDIQELIRNSGALGVQALANTLAREGRFFRTFFSVGVDPVPERMVNLLRVAAVAGALRNATFGQIGSVFPQMTDVVLNEGEWTAAYGTKIVQVPSHDFVQMYCSQDPAAIAERAQRMASEHPMTGLDPDAASRSACLSLALDDAVEKFNLDGGAFNCHGENCLQNPAIGVTACYAVSRQTTLGRPFSCTGDMPTAIALFVMKQLTGSVVYGELDLVDPQANAVVIANGGEGDFMATDSAVELVPNENFAGLHGRGASPRMTMRPGPATIASFTPIPRSRSYRLIAGVGDLIDLPVHGLRVFHQAFRFRHLCAETAFEDWCDAGAVHHLALAPGDKAEELRLLAAMMKVEFVQVGGSREAQG